MKLIPVDQIPKMNGYHKLQELIEEFTNGDAKIVKVEFSETDYKSPAVFVSCGQMKGDPTERCAQSRIFFGERMEMVEQAAIEAEPDLYSYLLRGVTEGLSYDALKMKYDIPCCRDVYYAAYRRFFWLLSKRRD